MKFYIINIDVLILKKKYHNTFCVIQVIDLYASYAKQWTMKLLIHFDYIMTFKTFSSLSKFSRKKNNICTQFFNFFIEFSLEYKIYKHIAI